MTKHNKKAMIPCFIVLLAVTIVSTVAASGISPAQQDVEISMPDVEWANVYAINQEAKMDYSSAVARAEMFADSFGVSVFDLNQADYRDYDPEYFAVLYGETPQWSYGYFVETGFEDFVDLDRFLKSDPDDKTPLIGEAEAVSIAMDFVDDNFWDSELASIRNIRFSRVWDEAQLTADEEERIIQKTSDEAVIKIDRSIDGIPVFGHGTFRIHVANDGAVVGAFRRCRHIDPVPVDIVQLPTLDEVENIAYNKLWKYCGDDTDCDMKVDVGYFEGDAGTRQLFLEPVIVISLLQKADGGDVVARRFTIPIRDVAVAENISPEEEPQPLFEESDQP